MTLDTLHAMRLFARVVELGGFSAAAREANLGQPAVSRIVAALDRSLGVRLLERTTTSVTPTEEGRRFYNRSKGLLEEYADAVADTQGRARGLAGLLVVNAPVGLGELRLNQLFLQFLAQYPEIELEVLLNDRVIDLVESGVDVAIRLGGDLPPHVIAREIAHSPRVLVASPAYIDRLPSIHCPEDLLDHNYLRFAGLTSGADLTFSSGAEQRVIQARGRYRINSSLALRESLLAGVGVASAPAWVVQDLIDAGDLIRLLAGWNMPPQPVHLVYPSRRYQPLRARAFLSFLVAAMLNLPGLYPPAAWLNVELCT